MNGHSGRVRRNGSCQEGITASGVTHGPRTICRTLRAVVRLSGEEQDLPLVGLYCCSTCGWSALLVGSVSFTPRPGASAACPPSASRPPSPPSERAALRRANQRRL
eukprot:2643373-Prymnesium_polylepis.1